MRGRGQEAADGGGQGEWLRCVCLADALQTCTRDRMYVHVIMHSTLMYTHTCCMRTTRHISDRTRSHARS